MKTLLYTGLLILVITLAGCLQTGTTGEGNPLGEGINVPSVGKLVAGAACETDNDCVYALNAYPIQKCISANCPPPEMEQPEPGDPKYEWKDAFLDECVNAAQLEGKNLQGEELLIDSRAATCACKPIELANTSLDGQKICRKQVSETPVENTGI